MADESNEFKYLPYVIIYVIVQLVILISFCYFYLRPKYRKDDFDRQDFFLTSIPNNPLYARIILWIVRLVFFIFFLAVIILAGEDHNEWYFFTHWNVWLILLYYTLAFTSSSIGLIYRNHLPSSDHDILSAVESNRSNGNSIQNSQRSIQFQDVYKNDTNTMSYNAYDYTHNHNSNGVNSNSNINNDDEQFTVDGEILNKDYRWLENKYMMYLGKVTHICFEFLGATAFLVTVLNFTLLSPSFTSDQGRNVNMHFITSVSFLIEMILNRMVVYIDHYRYMALWIISYAIVIWSTTYTNATSLDSWPYNFLKTDTTACFIWYEILIIASVLFYGVWMGLSYIKSKYLLRTSE